MRPFENLKIVTPVFGRLHLSAFAFVVVALLISCSNENKDQASSDQYTCPMHPTVLSPTQGTCPVCGMDLVRKARAGEELKITEDLARLLQSPDERVVANMSTVRGTYRKLPLAFDVQGVVTYDSRYTHVIPSRVAGRLERVHVHYEFQPVRKGQVMAAIYSPEMLAAQRELLFLMKRDPGNEEIVRSAREKLMLLGATPAQVDGWVQKGEPDPLFMIYSPYTGYVVLGETPGSATSPEPASNSMDTPGMSSNAATPAQTPLSTPSLFHEGGYVSRGQTLLTVVSRDALRIELSVPTAQAAHVKIGDVVSVNLGSGSLTEARVDFVQPFYSEGDAFIKVRAYMQNADLRIGQLVAAMFRKSTSESLWLPRDAVYDLGTSQIVFVKDRGLFKPTAVVTGNRSNGWIEIRNGLASGDEVAAHASYLVDSESFIKTSATK